MLSNVKCYVMDPFGLINVPYTISFLMIDPNLDSSFMLIQWVRGF